MMRRHVHLLLALLLPCWQCAGADNQPPSNSVETYNECVRQLNAPRVALLFLVRDDLFHRELWRQWLFSASGIAPMTALVQSAHRLSGQSQHGNQANAQYAAAANRIISACLDATAANTFATRRQYLFSVLQHTGPEFPFDPDAQLGGEHLPEDQRVPTNWGGTNLVDATRRLLQHALHDPLNHFFVLLSETSIPLYPPLVVYQQLIHRNTSAVNACPWASGEAPSIDRYDHTFRDIGLFARHQWRKSCQFVGLLRSHAQLVASDNPLWEAYSARCPGSAPCFADEHYIPLALSLHHLEHETDCHGHLTYTEWANAMSDTSPAVIQGENVSALHLAAFRAGVGVAVTHCSRLAMHPPPVDMHAFALLSQTEGADVVEAATRDDRDRLLDVLQQHPMDVLPDVSMWLRRYNAWGRRARITTAGLVHS